MNENWEDTAIKGSYEDERDVRGRNSEERLLISSTELMVYKTGNYLPFRLVETIYFDLTCEITTGQEPAPRRRQVINDEGEE